MKKELNRYNNIFKLNNQEFRQKMMEKFAEYEKLE